MEKTIRIVKTSTGRAERTNLNLVVKCGGVAEKLQKMQLAASLESMNRGTKSRRMKNWMARTWV